MFYIIDKSSYLLPVLERCFSVIDKDLVTAKGSRGAALPARGPGTIAQSFSVDVLYGDAGHRLRFVVGQDGRNGGVYDEGYQE